jgi:trk system potassium uptake protein TrkH
LSQDEQLATLTYAVRPRVVAKYTGQVGLALGALTLPVLLMCLYQNDLNLAWRYAAVMVVLALACIPAARLRAPDHIQVNEALVITALAFVLAPLLMTYPFMGSGLSFLDALFEAVSGVTTTGLSTVRDIQAMSPSFLFARAWMQWYGGLGIVVLSVALLSGHVAASRRLVDPEAGSENLVSTTRTHARRVLVVYLLLTVFGGAALLLFTSADPMDAITHTLSAVSTGGFSTQNDSLAGFHDLRVTAITSALSVLGAVSLPLYYWTWIRGWRHAAGDPELPALLIGIVLVSILLYLFMSPDLPAGEAAPNALFLGISAQTTTGFSTLDVAHLNVAAKLTLILSMMVGGSLGSTAGGIKLLRLRIVLRLIGVSVRATGATTHAVVQPRLGDRPLSDEDINRALLMVVLFAMVVAASWLAFLAAGQPPLDSLFEVVSATGTVGLSTGITSASLAAPLKWVLCFDMLAGRVEIIAMLVLLYPRTWIGRRVVTV